jgi:ferredoxin
MMIKVDKKKCIGYGICESLCPEVFEVGADGKAFVKVQKKLPCVKSAIDSCPVHAISEV